MLSSSINVLYNGFLLSMLMLIFSKVFSKAVTLGEVKLNLNSSLLELMLPLSDVLVPIAMPRIKYLDDFVINVEIELEVLPFLDFVGRIIGVQTSYRILYHLAQLVYLEFPNHRSVNDVGRID